MKRSGQRLSVLFVGRGPFGLQGLAASYMLPLTLFKKGYGVHVISFAGSEEKTKSVYGNKDLGFGVEQYSALGFKDRASIVREHIIRYRPDIVHCFKIPKYYFFPIYCKLSGALSPKWLIDIRSPPIYEKFSKGSFLKRTKAAVKKKTRSFYQLGFNVITTHALSSAHENFGKIVRPLYEVPLGVEPSMIKKKTWEKRRDRDVPLKFVYIGAISKNRRPEILIKAINMTREQIHKKKFKVDFYGGGDFVDEFCAMVDRMGLGEIICYRGVLEQPQLFQRLCEYDVGIGYVPYEHYMGSPALKILEYMAANLLVIASDTDGIKKQVTHNVNGLLFQNTPKSISNTMLHLLKNGCSPDIAEAGHEYAIKNSWESIVENNLLPVYEKILS